MVDVWYGVNAWQPGDAATAEWNSGTKQKLWPMRCMRILNNSTGQMYGGPMSRYSQIRKSAEMALVFDGLRVLDHNVNRISARHNNKKMTNILFVDGHCESLPTKSLPQDNKELNPSNTVDRLSAEHPHPKWRLDQQ
jgi:prepilin-type processing-associated H-X9-DG protein